jgi:hypothetical protein
MKLMEESRELNRAMELINNCIRRGDMIRLVAKDNSDMSIKLNHEMRLVVADMIYTTDNEIQIYDRRDII